MLKKSEGRKGRRGSLLMRLLELLGSGVASDASELADTAAGELDAADVLCSAAKDRY
jgi:hypothetical protein